MDAHKILVLAPHTDDGELGCGATISKLIRESKEIYYAAFSSCEDSLPGDMPKDTLKIELFNAMKCMGIARENVILFDYKVRCFSVKRQEILDDMIKLNNKIRPDTVFMPSIHDIHQDHYTVALEGMRAFKKCSILCYEVPWNNYTFNNQVFSSVEEIDVQNKINVIACYKSQKDRNYVKEDYTRGLLRTHGVQIGTQFAEIFETPRIIL